MVVLRVGITGQNSEACIAMHRWFVTRLKLLLRVAGQCNLQDNFPILVLPQIIQEKAGFLRVEIFYTKTVTLIG